MSKIKPRKWTDVYPVGTKTGDQEARFFRSLARNPRYDWRSTAAISKESGLSKVRVEEIINKYLKKGLVYQSPKNVDHWGYWERVPQMLPDDSGSIAQVDQKDRIDKALNSKVTNCKFKGKFQKAENRSDSHIYSKEAFDVMCNQFYLDAKAVVSRFGAAPQFNNPIGFGPAKSVRSVKPTKPAFNEKTKIDNPDETQIASAIAFVKNKAATIAARKALFADALVVYRLTGEKK